MKKWLLRILFLFLVLVVGCFIFAKSYLTRDYVVEKLEKSINSRVQVGELSVSLLGEVELRDVVITRRDENADNKVAHDDREALEGGKIMIDSVRFRLSFGEVISRKLSIDSVDIDGVMAKLEMLEDGSLDVEALFDKPDGVEKKEGDKRFNAKEHDFVTEIKELNLTNVDVDLVILKTQLLLQARNAEMRVSDIEVNPKRLETVNNARIRVGCELGLYSLDADAEYGRLGFSGDTTLTIFNTETGDLEPDMKVDLELSPDSYLTTKVPLINGVWDAVWKSFDFLAKKGMDKVRLPDRAEFRGNQKVALTYKLGRVDLLDSFSVHMSDWELTVLGDSEFNTGTGVHRAGLKLFVGEKVSSLLSGLLGKSASLGKLLGKFTGEEPGAKGKSDWMEDGRVFLLAESSGSLSKPRLRLKNSVLGSVQGTLDSLLDKKDSDRLKQGADLLKGLLR